MSEMAWQSKPNFMWILLGNGEQTYKRSRSHEEDGHHVIYGKNTEKSSQEPMNQYFVVLGNLAYHSLYTSRPLVDLDLFYDTVTFGHTSFSIQKSVSDGFFDFFYYMWPENW